jgi:hypothetical protein
MSRTLKVESFENRGDERTPFGFVYFNDGHRLVYGSKVTTGTGGWYAVTAEHLTLAQRYLAEHGIDLPIETGI